MRDGHFLRLLRRNNSYGAAYDFGKLALNYCFLYHNAIQ